jgi:hypothetical protein
MNRKLSRKLLGSTLAFGAALVFAGSAAQAGPQASPGNSVNISLSSTVQNACSIKTDTTAVTLGDVSATQFNGTIAQLTETCNDLAGGYTVKLGSQNAGTGGTAFYLAGANTSNTTHIPYTLSYNSAAVTLAGGTATISTGTVTPPTGVTHPLALTTTVGSYTADTYSDLLTITLTAS